MNTTDERDEFACAIPSCNELSDPTQGGLCPTHRRERWVRDAAARVLAGTLVIHEQPDGSVHLQGHPDLIAAIGLSVAAALHDAPVPAPRPSQVVCVEDVVQDRPPAPKAADA